MFISDIHGISTNLSKVKECFQTLGCEKLVILGDLYYLNHKNRINYDYNIAEVHEFLEFFKDNMVCIRGNCDSEVDSMVSDFPIVNELGFISDDRFDIYLTHGHIHNEYNWKMNNSILVYGHLHKPFIKEINGNLFLNPGSVSLPRGGYPPTYLVYDNGFFTIYDMEDKVVYKKNYYSKEL